MNRFDPSRDRAAAAASLWVARHDAGLDAAAEREFRLWLVADPAHAAAWREMNGAWEAFAPAGEPGLASAMVSELRRRRRRRVARRWKMAAAACSLVLLAMAASRFQPSEWASPRAASAAADALVSRTEIRKLSDGSEIELNGGAQIAVDYSPARRGIRLLHGEAHFTVAKNAARPFVVTAGLVRVRALGTRFAVRLQTESMDLLVTDGQVAVEQPSESGRRAKALPFILVGAGNRLSVSLKGPAAAAAGPLPVGKSESDRWLAWRGPRLVLSNTTLAEAVEALNRENNGHIVTADSDLAGMRLSGVFRADNADGFVRLLEASYGIRADRRKGEVILRSPAR